MLGLPEKKVRKVVQILAYKDTCIRLCDDGSIWTLEGGKWKKAPDVPQGDEG